MQQDRRKGDWLVYGLEEGSAKGLQRAVDQALEEGGRAAPHHPRLRRSPRNLNLCPQALLQGQLQQWRLI